MGRSLSFRRLSLLPLDDPPSLFRLPPLFGAGSERGASAGGGLDGGSERGDSAGGLGGGSFLGVSAGGLGGGSDRGASAGGLGGSGLLSEGGLSGTGFVSWAHAIAGVKNATQNRTAGNKLSLTASDFMCTYLPGLARQKLQLSRRADVASDAIIRADSHRATRKLRTLTTIRER